MSRLRIVIAAVAGILIVIVALQNTESVETKLLLVTLEMPRAVLLFVTFVVGFILGLLAAVWTTRRKPQLDEGPKAES